MRGRLRFPLTGLLLAACVCDLGGLEILRLWHPFPFNGFGSDFYLEALPAYRALAHGHLVAFVTTGPSYLGSMLLRAPFALPAIWLAGTPREVYFVTAIPGLLAAPLLGAWLMRRAGVPRPGHLILMFLIVLPTTAFCLDFGHPEDILTGALAIAAVVCAGDGRGLAAGTLVALATAAKPWAAGAIPVAFVVCGDKRRFLVSLVALSLAFWGPVEIIQRLGSGGGGAGLSTGTGEIFGAAQLLYPLGSGNWLVQNAHPLIVVASWCLAGLWWVFRRHDPGIDRAAAGLWLLTLVLFVRCAFDPWDNAYYPLAFLMALLATGTWRAAALAVGASWLLLVVDSPNMILATSPGEGARTYAIVAVPILLGLGLKVLHLPGGRPRRVRSAAQRPWLGDRRGVAAMVALDECSEWSTGRPGGVHAVPGDRRTDLQSGRDLA